ncbi:MAG: restriction endonuclease subunit S [Bacillota bacterium]|nr:restriction endonuclease subunit S [Bacillota bacterium]
MFDCKKRHPKFIRCPVWEQRKLGNLCERIRRKNKNGESDLPLTIASQYGLIDQRDFFNKVVAAKDMSNYYLLKKGEFAYNKSYSNGYDYGSIKRLNAYEQGCLSTLYICFGITSDDIESDYLECFFDTLKWYSDITMICAEGARNHGLLNVDTKAFFDEVTILMPSSKEEQKKISAYLNNLDNLITLHQRQSDMKCCSKVLSQLTSFLSIGNSVSWEMYLSKHQIL